jgi:tetratricopeptide (TPR) repeat protein
MNLTDSHLKELDDPALTQNERVLLRCRLASEFIHVGQYETAREALEELWQGVGARPDVEKLKPFTAAEVLLRCGALSGWVGGAQHIGGAQEKAKDLLFESLRMFKAQNQGTKVSEAKYELSRCYFRLGAYDDARMILKQAMEGLGERDDDLKAKIYIRQSVCEIWTSRYHDALCVLEKAREFFESSGDAIKGKWHSQRGIVLRRLAIAEHRPDYADRAIMEFTAAIFHCEQAGHERYCANNLNNLAMLLYQLGRYADAHERLDRAKDILTRLQDTGILASVNETRSRVFVAEGNYNEAVHLIVGVIQTFEKANEFGLLADALTVQGVALAHLGSHEKSIQILRRAMNVALDAGANSDAARAALTLIEEHGKERLSNLELYETYRRADTSLRETDDREELARLNAAARLVTKRLLGVTFSDKDFCLPDVVHAFEARFIREALEGEQGAITRAARRLGVRHQTLIRSLETRHRDLLPFRRPARTRRKRIVSKCT